ncbi:nucleotide-binding domain-containing protein [Nemania sp. FL0031]|nr:nucleotide-binding domain-containing protein [Nemania sp. FL0031]
MPLTFGVDISPEGKPLRQPSSNSPHILVIGGGVIGLISAWVMLDRGYRVTVVSKSWVNDKQRLTSQIAGALWEFPPAVCGQHTDAISLAHSKKWCMTAYHIWDAIASIPSLSQESGVRMMPSDFFFLDKIENDPHESSKMAEIKASGVRGFYRGADIIEDRGVDPSYGAVDAYEIMAPIIDTDKAMYWLTSLVEKKGAVFVTETIEDDLVNVEDSLLARFNADVIINCAGLQSATLAGDETVYPIRGGLIRVINDGTLFPKVNAALTITADAAHTSNEIVFIVPRNDNILLIGGITEPHKWNLDLTLETPIIRRMRERCDNFLPGLKDARLDADYPLAQGLRPFRGSNVRVERELRRTGSKIVHSYGHGGAGWSLSFGCAQDVAVLVEQTLAGIPARPMAGRFGRRGKMEITASL